MIKYFCDACGKEAHSSKRIWFTFEDSELGTVDIELVIKVGIFEICTDCVLRLARKALEEKSE
jgi:hypothetical protein